MLQTKRHARLQITTKMQHFMVKMQKKFWGGGTAPFPYPLPMARGTPLPIPHPFRRLTQNAFGVRAPLITVL